MKVSVKKLTDLSLLHRANEFTTGHESKMSLATAYRLGHSPSRTQIFWLELKDIPLFVASQLVRSHVGLQFYQKSKRVDRGGKNFKDICEEQSRLLMEAYDAVLEGDKDTAQHLTLCVSDNVDEFPNDFDRLAPTDLAGIINAEAIINMSMKRLCHKASAETRTIWQAVLDEIAKVDPDLVKFCQKPCVWHGFCREPKPCGYMSSEEYNKRRESFVGLFNK